MLFSKHFRGYYIKYIIPYVIGIGVLLFIDYIQLNIPEYIGQIIDTLRGDQNMIEMRNLLVLIGYLALIITLGRFLWRYTIFGASRNIQFDLMNKMFKHATELPQSFYANEKVGGMMAYYTNDLEAIRMAYGPGILMLVDGVALGSFAVVKMLRLNTTMTLYAGIPLIVMFVFLSIVMRRFQKMFKIRQESFEDLSDFTQENYSGITVVKAFVRELKQSITFDYKSKDLYGKTIGFVKYQIAIQIIISVAINIIVLFIVVYGSFQVMREDPTLTAGQLTEYMAYFFTLLWPTMALARFFVIQSQAKASAERINEYLDAEISVKDSEDVKSQTLFGEIEAKHLTFTYPDGDTPVLNDVSFKIKKGEMVGILGRTGSGKSSLVDLFLRTYNVNEGQLFIAGHDMMTLPIKDVRELMGYVPQDNFLFSETIKDNIAFAYEDADLELVTQAAKLSDVHDNIVEFKHQYETMLGERGVTVSGGQKQRLSIARAIAKDPEILILDDSVSAVDTKTEEAIISNLFKIRKNKTTIVIAHRISTVKHMDKIILLDHGKLVGLGSHEELLKSSPLYQDMVRRQQLETMIEEEGDDA
ncbi:MAG: ABC transporter ATP-binding protein [Acholeplasmataceae bacterium]